MLEEIKTTYEAALILGMTQRNVAGICGRGGFLGAIKKGKTWLIPYEAIKIYIIQHGNKKQRNQHQQLNKEAV